MVIINSEIDLGPLEEFRGKSFTFELSDCKSIFKLQSMEVDLYHFNMP